MTPRRGDLWLVDFGDPVGRGQAGMRPALVVSSDGLNDGPAGLSIVVPMTSTRRGIPSHIEIDEAGLDEVSYAKCEDVKAVSEERFVTRLGEVSPEVMFGVDRALRFLLEL